MNNLNNMEQTKGTKIFSQILKSVREKALAFQYGTHYDSGDKQYLNIPVLKTGATATIVPEGAIATTSSVDIEMVNCALEKAVVIIPYSKEQYKFSDLDNLPKELEDIAVDSISKKIDELALAEVLRNCQEVTSEGDIAKDINASMKSVETVADYKADKVLLPVSSKYDLRAKAIDGTVNGISADSVFGIAPIYVDGDNKIVLDSKYLAIVTNQNIEVEHLTEATIKIGEEFVSLPQNSLEAIKLTCYFNVKKLRDNAVAKVTE